MKKHDEGRVEPSSQKEESPRTHTLEPNFLIPKASFQAIYQGAVGPVTWIVSSEMYPPKAETGFIWAVQ